jgi:predicted nucleotide-binding protein
MKKKVAEVRAGINRLRRCIDRIRAFDHSTIESGTDPRITILQTAVEKALTDTFGRDTPEYQLHKQASSLNLGILRFASPNGSDIREGLSDGKARSVAILQEAIWSLEELTADAVPTEVAETTVAPLSERTAAPPAASDEVFIVHGWDDNAKIEVARMIERAGLKAVILHEQANSGRTIIEKFEHHAGLAGFAVVVLTPDDIGGPKEASSLDALSPRARQNVIGEMFWFAGKFGRKRVCALIKSEIEMPSDFAGLGYTKMDESRAWKHELLRELEAAGYTVDWKKALA